MTTRPDSFLEDSAAKYHSTIVKGWEKLYQKKRAYLYETLKKYFCGEKVLELGCADGIITQWLSRDFQSVTVVDGSEAFINEVKGRIISSNIKFIHSMFEGYSSTEKYDTIIMTHILEHLDEPVLILKRSREWLASNGRILIGVPNADSLHRLVGVKMGLLTKKDSLNEQDIILGHKRVYTPELLKKHISDAGFRIERFGGNMIKPLSNRQIEADWSDELINAFFKLGDDFPELCSEIYAVISVTNNMSIGIGKEGITMSIPFVDLKAQYQSIKSEIDTAIKSVIEETAFVRGKYVAEFEKAYAEKYRVKHCISLGNGTDAIYIILKALGIGPGNEVITVANSWISTSETISQAGARPAFVDIEPDYFTIDASKIEEKITSRTKAILPVHLYGQPAEIDTIKKICETHNLHLIEDCAQAHFATYEGQLVGTFGIAGAFSFYPSKNLGAYGDAGAIITNSDELAYKMRMFANHGALKKHHHEIEGINSRMDGLQAAILSVKLPCISKWNQKRYQNALLYNELLANVENITTPKIRSNASHVFHLYVIRTKKRDELQKHLKEHGIDTAIHYPVALPFMQAYKYLGHKPEDFPVAYQYQDEILSLPMYPELSNSSIIFITEQIREFFTR